MPLVRLQDAATGFLHRDEQAELSVLGGARTHSYLLGRYCAKAAVCRQAGVADARTLSLTRGVFGFPLVRGAESAHVAVSLSHTDAWGAAVAFDERHPMGIDVQDVGTNSVETARTQTTQHEQQLAALASIPCQAGPVLLWSMKEALSKVLRTGLMTPLDVYELDELEQQGNRWTGSFRNFAQYKAVAFLLPDAVCALVLPKRSQVEWPEIAVAIESEAVAPDGREA